MTRVEDVYLLFHYCKETKDEEYIDEFPSRARALIYAKKSGWDKRDYGINLRQRCYTNKGSYLMKGTT